jgi:signal transduction histidine kinase
MMHEGAAAQSRAQSGRFDWTRIHFVYLALAAFDLLAILTGLGLSEWSNSQHARTVDKVNQTTFLREHIRELQDHAIKLSSAAQALFASGDLDRAKLDIDYLKSDYGLQFSTAAFERKLAAMHPLMGEAATSPATNAGLEGANLMRHFTYATEEDIARYATAKGVMEGQIVSMYADVKAFASALTSGNASNAVDSRMKFEKSFQSNMQDAANIASLLDNELQRTVKESSDAFGFATLIQYAVGAAILLMILAACTYAHFVGKLLRSKYREIEDSKFRAESAGVELATANAEVNGLNQQLQQNLHLLKTQQEDLVRKGRMEQLGQLTATVAHELRNPLGGMKTSAFLLERKLLAMGIKEEPSIQRINNGVNRCDKIISQLLDYSRTQSVIMEPADLDQCVEETVQEEAAKLPQNISVIVMLGLSGVTVAFDAARVRRAVTNLLANASEAIIAIKDEDWPADKPREIRISTFMGDDQVAICITDNGPGIADNVIKRVREPLFTTKSFGAGLGIPAAEQIVHLHGGSLEIESTPGQGAAFTLRLPVMAKETAKVKAAA